MDVRLTPALPSPGPLAGPVAMPEAFGRRVLEGWWAGLNPHTRRCFGAAYRQAAAFFQGAQTEAGLTDAGALAFLGDFFASHSKGMAYARVSEFRTHLEAKDLAPGSVNRRLTALKSLCKRLSIAGVIPYELPIERLPEELYRDTAGPGAQTVGAMLEATTRGRDADIRDRAILRLLADLALRRQELTSLDLQDVDLPGKILWVLRKGHRQRIKLALTRRAVEDLEA